MSRLILVCAMACCLAPALSSCRNTPDDQGVEIRRSMEKYTRDPDAIQLRKLRHPIDGGQGVCGEANLKNDNGIYSGFELFLFRGRVVYFWQPAAIQTKDWDIPLKACADSELMRAYQERKNAANVDFERRMNSIKDKARMECLEAAMQLAELGENPAEEKCGN